MVTKQLLLLTDRPGVEFGGAAGDGGRGWLHRAWRRGVGVCLFMVVASFSFFLVSSPHRARFTDLTAHRSSPEYIFDFLMLPSNTSKSVPTSPPSSPPKSPQSPSSTNQKNPRESFNVPKGFLVHSPSCSIPDLDPHHPSIQRFISHPKPVLCRGPPAFTSARGATLYLNQDILRRHLNVIQQIYWDELTTTIPRPLSLTSTHRPQASSTTTATTPRPLSSTKTHQPQASSTTTTPKPQSSTTIHPPQASSTTTTNTITTTASVNVTSHTSSSKASPTSSSSPSSSTTEGGRVKVGVDAVRCCYKGMHRVEQTREKAGGAADGRWRYNEACQPFNASGTEVQEEAALVVCSIGEIVVYKNVHYFFRKRENAPVPSVQEGAENPPLGTPGASTEGRASGIEGGKKTPAGNSQTKNVPGSTPGPPQPSAAPSSSERQGRVEGAEKLSVIFIGTDSASRLNMLRFLPKTYEYLTQELGALDLQGYNKVGDNTFPNLLAYLGGYFSEEVDKTCITKSRHYDDCHWVWKDFKRNGYVTAYMEDAPWMGAFHYLRRGFISQPTDFYSRPFFLASEKEIGQSHKCQGAELSLKVVQDYSLEFTRTFLDTPSFGFFWSASLTHDYLNTLRHADEPHLRYLKELKEMGALNHTAVFFVSDHGMRWGNLRATYIGMLEERLPYVVIYLPPWFRKKYHQAYANVVTNTHRLTANFDVHETLLDLAYGRFADLDHVTSTPSEARRGISLFRSVPWNRTCANAGISQHYCACQNTVEVAKDDQRLYPAAEFLRDFLNEKLRPYPQCEQFSKVEVNSARVYHIDEELKQKELQSEVRTYLLQATLSPGRVVVEASLRHSQQDNAFKMLGSVSRVSKYGDTSGCIRHDLLRQYCYCRDQKNAQRLFNEFLKMQDGEEVGAALRKGGRRNAA
ncbi:uncharacterized protein LOC127001523 isoform X2 [Eriocheir sinensis]|uniref:uncharacterized protein LOC127001523 isoform X2 n=1 Tax=Eriocheir sinensis TaxID=95602 RepID=UPI0021C97568|nr:uncharacterized protein LOC127001523 isoform X2 [Eriocheir sinensis]